MIAFTIFTLAVLLLPLTGFVLYGTHNRQAGASNSPVFIEMPKRGTGFGGSVEIWDAVWAEENVEQYVRWIVALAVVHVGLLIWPQPDIFVTNLAAIFLACAACIWSTIPVGYRVLEYFGKAAGISLNNGQTVAGAANFLKHYTGHGFETMTQAQIERGLRRALPVSRVLCKLLVLRLRRGK